MNTKQLTILSTFVIATAVLIVGWAVSANEPVPRVDCTGIVTRHQVYVDDFRVEPATTKATRCDQLTITNQATQTVKIGFGEHSKHTAYDGVEDKVLKKGDSLTITLSKTGNFSFHDHFREQVKGSFTVTDR